MSTANFFSYWLSDKKQDDSNYDEIKDIPNQPTLLNNDASDMQDNRDGVVDNPYYGGVDDLNTDDVTTNVNVLDNPYYGELEEDGDEDKVNVIDK